MDVPSLRLVVDVGFGFFWWIFLAVFLGKQEKSTRELFDQNHFREKSALSKRDALGPSIRQGPTVI